MDTIFLKALAKINLTLDVLRKREDGYHEVRMVMQTISLYDRLNISKVAKPGISIASNAYHLPTDESNLIYKAARLLMDEFEVQDGIFVDLDKRIPMAAGMAGGSSDAAATLVGVNKLFGLGLTKRQLMERGAQIGADVPYCVMRGTALAEGIGEKLTRLPSMVECPVLIAKPKESLSTKFVYQNLKLDETVIHPDVDAMIADIKARDLHAVARDMGNVLETVSIPHLPVIGEIKERMMAQGALGAMMSGSGPTVFGLFENVADCERAKEAIWESGLCRHVYFPQIQG
ncbi:MAG: 4-(cytidine 5'-diphospho)-2-C-methyl-D-erythritol kinase [Clostridiales bacterium]|nr:4-(cytidine 5'-diphospho)-2-C-methyl-D-erythritol kinase [Clostridiales bacterium]